MRVRSAVCWLPKEGNLPEEYEDACWPLRDLDLRAPSLRLAVADGATETSFSGLWARMLVRAWCRGQLSGRRLGRALSRLQREWQAEVGGPPLPWYAEEKLRSGAFSTLLGLQLDEASQRWQAQAIGDSCLFQVRRDRLLAAFPVSCSGQLNSRPRLLSTRAGSNGDVAAMLSATSGSWRSGDVFYLMTDALAGWFLQEVEAGGRPWHVLRSVVPFTLTPRPIAMPSTDRWVSGTATLPFHGRGGGPTGMPVAISHTDPSRLPSPTSGRGVGGEGKRGEGAFSDFIAHLRHNALLRNDDVSLIRVCLS